MPVSDNRRRIAALRAKAASTTFPAEAASLRAKADELEGKQAPSYVGQGTTVRDVQNEYARRAADWVTEPIRRYENIVRVHGNFFEQMGGIRVTFGQYGQEPTEQGRVTDMQGNTYWITVE